MWLTETFKLCEALSDVETLANWFESVYFNMAMGEPRENVRCSHAICSVGKYAMF